MNLLPGCRLAVAPHFHLPVNWEQRVRLGAGVDVRGATAEELACLIAPASTGREQLQECVCLFGLPQHLRDQFWEMLDRAEQGGMVTLPGFDAFAAEIDRFLSFKQLNPPAGGRYDLLVTQPGQASGMQTLPGPVHFGINLGDEATALVFANAAGPPLRVWIEPGEGFRVPAGLMVDVDSRQKQEADLLLVIRPALVTPAP